MFYFLTILALSVFDIVATHYCIIVAGSFSIEANPLMRWVMIEWGLQWAYVLRIVGPLIGTPILLWARTKVKLAQWALWITVVLLSLIACYHLYNTQFFTIH